jgi:hypothetical protein
MAPRTQTNNPLETTPPKIAGNLRSKTGAGVRYLPAGRVGPSVQTPSIAHASQSSRANALDDGGGPTINRDELTSRTLDRAALSQTPAELYGA